MSIYEEEDYYIDIVINAIWDCITMLQQCKSEIDILYQISETSYDYHNHKMMINLEGYTYIIPDFTPIYEIEHLDSTVFIAAIKRYILDDKYNFTNHACFTEVIGLSIIVNYLLKRNEHRHIKFFSFMYECLKGTKNIDGIIDTALKLLVFQINFETIKDKYPECIALHINNIINTPKCIF